MFVAHVSSKVVWIMAVSCAALVAAACTVEDTGDGTFQDQEVTLDFSDSLSLGELPYSDAGATSDELTGTWAMFSEMVSCVDFVGTQSNVTLTTARVELTQDGLQIHEARSTCKIESSVMFGLLTVIPQAVLDAVNPYYVDSFVLGQYEGAGYATEAELRIWGVHLADPYEDLPVSADDPRVFDADNDGLPGVTITFDGGFCEMYVIQRSINFYNGVVVSPQEITGTLVSLTKQNVLDASTSMCAVGYVTRPYNELNRFRLVRVDGVNGSPDLDLDDDGTVSCAEILQYKELLFTMSEPGDEICD